MMRTFTPVSASATMRTSIGTCHCEQISQQASDCGSADGVFASAIDSDDSAKYFLGCALFCDRETLYAVQ